MQILIILVLCHEASKPLICLYLKLLIHQFPYEHWSYATLGLDNTWMGDPPENFRFCWRLSPSPLRTEYSLLRLSLSQSTDWDLLKPKKTPSSLFWLKFKNSKIRVKKLFLKGRKSLSRKHFARKPWLTYLGFNAIKLLFFVADCGPKLS